MEIRAANYDAGKTQSESSEIQFDYIFAGFGASASLLLLEMNRRKLLNHAKVLIVEPESKEINDKTFCFWASENDPIVSDLELLISHSWSEASVANQKKTVLKPYCYYHIPSIHLYNHAGKIIEQHGCTRLNQFVNEIGNDESGTFVCVGEKKLRAERVFDSRPPVFNKPAGNETHILQSFIGWLIQTENPAIEEHSINFMDFDVEQDGGTQFVYMLPYSSNTALVELTRFGSDKISEEEGGKILEKYILKRYGPFSINSVEKGCIPMSNAEIIPQDLTGISLLGARNYSVKPSTGYAFKNMYRQAADIANSLVQSNEKTLDKLNNTHKKNSSGRFAFYDSLLLWILKNKPESGKFIFTKLFHNTRLGQVLQFLDERSNLLTEIRMFSGLPLKPFLRALFHQTDPGLIRPFILLITAMLLIAMGCGSSLQLFSGYFLFLSGMFLVGIPHGAVDHLLETGKWNNPLAAGFIIRYLLQAAVMAMVWYFTPDLALIIFLAYSAWHFGQADGHLWGFSKGTSLLWGSSVLLYILGTHSSETNGILKFLGSLHVPFECPAMVLLPWLIYAIFRGKHAFAITITWLSISSQLPLIFAFGLYFIGQHSSTSWMQICRHLQLTQKRVWLHALPFHISAWLLMSLFFFTWPVMDSSSVSNQWAVFFIFIACISFPHTLAMKIVYARKSE